MLHTYLNIEIRTLFWQQVKTGKSLSCCAVLLVIIGIRIRPVAPRYAGRRRLVLKRHLCQILSPFAFCASN